MTKTQIITLFTDNQILKSGKVVLIACKVKNEIFSPCASISSSHWHVLWGGVGPRNPALGAASGRLRISKFFGFVFLKKRRPAAGDTKHLNWVSECISVFSSEGNSGIVRESVLCLLNICKSIQNDCSPFYISLHISKTLERCPCQILLVIRMRNFD